MKRRAWLVLMLVLGCGSDVTQGPGTGGSGAAGAGGGDANCPLCPPGYTPVGTDCVWYGGPTNGDFDSLDAWVTEGDVEIDPTDAGLSNPGVARFFDVCDHGLLRQSFEMPTFECAEPLWLTLDAWNACDVCSGIGRLLVDINRGRHRLYMDISVGAQGVCLGERAFGGMVEIAIEARADDCVTSFQAEVDAVDVRAARPASEPPPPPDEEQETMMVACPAPGEIVNGDFEKGTLGWLPDTGAIGSGFGIGGTTGARLECGIDLGGAASLPMHESVPQPAIELWAHGVADAGIDVTYSEDTPFAVLNDELYLGRLSSVTQDFRRICIPRWAQGVSRRLGFRTAPPCDGAEYSIDNMAVVSEPACGDSALIFDPDFELAKTNPELASPWRLSGGADLVEGSAHSGRAALMLVSGQLDQFDSCVPTQAAQDITIPAGEPRPGLRFWYRTEGLDTASVYIGSDQLPASSEWTEHIQCLAPERADAAHHLILELRQTNVCPEGERVLFDGFELLTDATCD